MNDSKRIAVLFLLVAYLSQSLAAVGAPCLMLDAATEGASAATDFPMSADPLAGDMQHMGHAGHDRGPVENAKAGGNSSCCDGGFCSLSHCQSVAVLPQSVLPGVPVPVAIYRDFSGFAPLNSSPVSPYRPPISR